MLGRCLITAGLVMLWGVLSLVLAPAAGDRFGAVWLMQLPQNPFSAAPGPVAVVLPTRYAQTVLNGSLAVLLLMVWIKPIWRRFR